MIKHQILDLDLPGEGDHFALQQQISTLYQGEVLPRLDRMLEQLVPPDQLLRIQRMEVDLGDLDLDRLETDFVNLCLEQIEKAIRRQTSTTSEDGSTPIETKSETQALLEVFFYFLKTGSLPWNTQKEWKQDLENALLACFSELEGALAIKLRSILRSESTAVSRLVRQFSSPFLMRILRLLSSEQKYNALQQVWTVIEKIPEQDWKDRHARRKTHLFFWKAVLENILYHPDKDPDYRKMLEYFLPAFLKQFEDPLRAIRQLQELISRIQGHSKQLPEQIQQLELRLHTDRSSKTEWEKAIAEVFDFQEKSDNFNRSKAAPPGHVATGDGRETSNSATGSSADDPDDEPAPETCYFIQNAGLVLIGSYLPRFFSALELVEKGKFVSDDAQEKAVHLLAFLVNFTGHPMEFDLTLNKLLCGFPLALPVEREILLSENEQKECRELLSAVVKHWGALGNTSPEGLQDGFLQRTGKLSYNESNGSWLLQVEKKGIDVLLDKIPWVYSLIKLPWMKDRLTVEWR